MSKNPFECLLDSETKTSLKLYLFKNVANVERIRKEVLNGSWSCAVIKPYLIMDVFQVVVAANKAALSAKRGSLITRTVHSEVLYNLSPTKNITQSLSKFGIENDREILLCFLLDESTEDCSQDVLSQIDGEMCSIENISEFTNYDQVKSVYKLKNVKCNTDLLDAIISKMVTKNFISH